MELIKIIKELGLQDKTAMNLSMVQQVVNRALLYTTSPITPTVTTEPAIPQFKSGRPTKLKKGDVFVGFSVNGKQRPFVVAKVLGDTAQCVALTTTKDAHTLIPHKSRFFGQGYFSNSFSLVKTEYISKRFVGVMDDTRNLNKAIKLITEKTLKELS